MANNASCINVYVLIPPNLYYYTGIAHTKFKLKEEEQAYIHYFIKYYCCIELSQAVVDNFVLRSMKMKVNIIAPLLYCPNIWI